MMTRESKEPSSSDHIDYNMAAPTPTRTSTTSMSSESESSSDEEHNMSSAPSSLNTSLQSIYFQRMACSAKNVTSNVSIVTANALTPCAEKLREHVDNSIYLQRMASSAKNVKSNVSTVTHSNSERVKSGCTQHVLSSDRRKIEVLVVLFSALFLFAALAAKSIHKNSPAPPTYTSVGSSGNPAASSPFDSRPPPPFSTPQDPAASPSFQVVVQPTFPPVEPIHDENDEPTDGDQDEDIETVVKPSTYIPGDLSVTENGLLLSTGLKSRIIAKSGTPVVNIYGVVSPQNFHPLPDAGACFENPDGSGGWVYVSNSEEDYGKGGVGAIYFDASGNVLSYKRLLDGTTDNCGGGKTPWGTFITLEENKDHGTGIWEVDPWYERPPSLTALAERKPGMYESFAYDNRNPFNPHFFFTEDAEDGTLRKFSPNPSSISADPKTMWRMLYDEGYRHEYLVLNPSTYTTTADGTVKPTGGQFQWTDDIEEGRASATQYYQFTEGIDCRDGMLYFISKTQKELFVLNLDYDTWTVSSTEHGAFSQPDQLYSIFPSQEKSPQDPNEDENIIYFTEDGGSEYSGLHARDMKGRYFTILESVTEIITQDETTGLAFSPDRRHIYFALQKNGNVFDIWREDGHAFAGKHLDIKYHASSTNVNRRNW